MWLTIPLIVIVLALMTIIVIVMRRLPHVRFLRTDMLQREHVARVKLHLLEKRFMRKMKDTVHVVGHTMTPLLGSIKDSVSRMYQKAVDMEQQYRKLSRAIKHDALAVRDPKAAREEEQRLIKVLQEGKDAFAQGNVTDAEKKFVEAISLDPHYADAYRGLGEMYMSQEEWQQAHEVFLFLVKLLPADANVHACLGQCRAQLGEWVSALQSYKLASEIAGTNAGYYFEWGNCAREAGEREEALRSFAKAVEIEGNNPKYLDFLIEASILAGNKLQAQNAFDALKSVNPENQKLDEFRQRIEQMGRRWVMQGKQTTDNKQLTTNSGNLL